MYVYNAVGMLNSSFNFRCMDAATASLVLSGVWVENGRNKESYRDLLWNGRMKRVACNNCANRVGNVN